MPAREPSRTPSVCSSGRSPSPGMGPATVQKFTGARHAPVPCDNDTCAKRVRSAQNTRVRCTVLTATPAPATPGQAQPPHPHAARSFTRWGTVNQTRIEAPKQTSQNTDCYAALSTGEDAHHA